MAARAEFHHFTVGGGPELGDDLFMTRRAGQAVALPLGFRRWAGEQHGGTQSKR